MQNTKWMMIASWEKKNIENFFQNFLVYFFKQNLFEKKNLCEEVEIVKKWFNCTLLKRL